MNQRLWRRLKYLFLGIVGCLLAFLIWGVIEPYHLDRNVVVADIPSLPQSWQGKQIAVISDFQIGMWMGNTRTIEQAIAQIIADRPAAALIAGDFVYKPGEALAPELIRVLDLVRPLAAAQIPTYAVLGNHDYDAPTEAAGHQRAARIQQALESAGIQVLQNEAIALSNTDQASGDENLYLVGLGSYSFNQSKPLVAIAQVPDHAARFVLMHNPASFSGLPESTAPVAVAGHTHGGQIRIPFLPEWSWVALVDDKPGWSWLSQIKGDVVRISGWIPGYGKSGNRLYINRGIGFSHLPVRFNCPPELTVFTLQTSVSISVHSYRYGQ